MKPYTPYIPYLPYNLIPLCPMPYALCPYVPIPYAPFTFSMEKYLINWRNNH